MAKKNPFNKYMDMSHDELVSIAADLTESGIDLETHAKEGLHILAAARSSSSEAARTLNEPYQKIDRDKEVTKAVDDANTAAKDDKYKTKQEAKDGLRDLAVTVMKQLGYTPTEVTGRKKRFAYGDFQNHMALYAQANGIKGGVDALEDQLYSLIRGGDATEAVKLISNILKFTEKNLFDHELNERLLPKTHYELREAYAKQIHPQYARIQKLTGKDAPTVTDTTQNLDSAIELALSAGSEIDKLRSRYHQGKLAA